MSIHKPVMAAAVAVALAAGWSTLNAQVRTPADTARTPWRVRTPSQTTAAQTGPAAIVADSAFIRQATAGNLLEVRLGELAEDRASGSQVKTFGDRMADDHEDMQERWEKLVSRNALRIRPTLGPAEASEVTRLSGLSGSAFDRAYMTTMIRQHENDVATFQQLAQSARSEDVRKLASEDLVTIQQHLTMARQVGSQVGVSAPVATTLPSDTGRLDTFRTSRTGGRADEARRVAKGKGGSIDLAAADRDFVREVVADHLTQIRLADRARREARNGDTRRFAEQLSSDLEKWQERWTDLADRGDLKVSKGLGRNHQDKIQRLEKASKNNVDRVYASIVIEHLESIVPYFQKEGRSVESPAVRRLVNEELPVIREYVARAKRLEGAESRR